MDDFGAGCGGVEMQVRDGDRKIEAAWAAASWVEIEDAVAGFDARLVRVAGDDDGDAGGLWVEVEVGDGVQHVDELVVELDSFGGGEMRGVAVDVDVAADGGDGRDFSQGFEEVEVADIACVEDVRGAAESGEGFGAEEGMGVGEDGDHGRSEWLVASS